MMAEWQETTLGKLCEESGGDIQTGPFGSQLHASDYVSAGIPSIMPQNIGDNRISTDGIARIKEEDAKRLARYLVRDGDIVYSRRGDVERRALIRDRENGWLCGTGCLRVRFGDKKKINPTFISYYLGAPDIRSWIVQHAVGATMPNLNTGILSNVPVLLPDYPNQKAIAAILGALDDKIELNRRMNATLEAMARALFKSWFVDFDAVRARMEVRPPFGMDTTAIALFPAAFEKSATGEIPKGWQASDISKFALLNSESWSSREHPASIHYVDLANTKWGTIESLQSFAWEEAPSRAQRVIRTGDTIVGTVRPGNGSYAYVHKDGLTASTGFAALRPREAIFKEFIYLAVTHRENIERLAHIADGGAYPAVRPEVVAATPAIWPGEDILKAFSQILSPCFDRMAANKKECDTLSSLRDTLLPKLISGELRVRDAEKFLKDAA